jgi:hypothetical protein
MNNVFCGKDRDYVTCLENAENFLAAYIYQMNYRGVFHCVFVSMYVVG